MVAAADPAEALEIREQVIRGFYAASPMPKIRRKRIPATLLRHNRE